nr:uncharacterized protein CI109_006757 [Kwoniella shandongensis]KAA5524886.1 hypothetical protein CI109_006757 [Kwoniella shandongensis]
MSTNRSENRSSVATKADSQSAQGENSRIHPISRAATAPTPTSKNNYGDTRTGGSGPTTTRKHSLPVGLHTDARSRLDRLGLNPWKKRDRPSQGNAHDAEGGYRSDGEAAEEVRSLGESDTDFVDIDFVHVETPLQSFRTRRGSLDEADKSEYVDVEHPIDHADGLLMDDSGLMFLPLVTPAGDDERAENMSCSEKRTRGGEGTQKAEMTESHGSID